MKSSKQIKDTRQEGELFRRRAIAVFAMAFVCLVGLGVRFYFLQVLRYDNFSARSESNRISMRRIAPSRGLIYDRNGVLLAENVAAFRLEVTPEQVGDMSKMLDDLRRVVPLDDDDIARFNALRKLKRPYQSIPLRLKLAEEEIARFAIDRWRFPGVEVVPYLTRSYPLGKEFAHVVGYVGRIDEADLARLDADAYDGTTHIGKTGVERSHEDLLHGEPGYELVEVNADRRPLRSLERVAPKPGKNIYLAIDARLQEKAEEAFAGAPGSAVAIDPRNGEVLAMVSVPGFDPNLFVNGISRTDYQGLLTALDQPLFDRALIGSYAPGSTLKPFFALAGLELGVRRSEDTVLSTGEFSLPGQKRTYRDWRAGGHGRVNLVQALAQSVNTYFYSLALDMGIDRMADYMGKFGFGEPTGIDLVGEARGILPSREWKEATQNKPWYPGETVICGIGQGYWVVTPLQLGNALAMLAAQGVEHRPHLLKATQDGFNAPIVAAPQPPAPPSIVNNMANWEVVRQGMVDVMGPGGTASRIGADSAFPIAGKSGTAQRFSRREDGSSAGSELEARQRYKVLFVGFAPADDPQIAVAVVLEAGTGGSREAAPIVKAMLDQWLLKTATAAPPTNVATP